MVELITETPSEEQVEALKSKHRSKIDLSLARSSQEQQERLKSFGHDPKEIAAHYAELTEKSQQLAERNVALERKTTVAASVAAITAFTASTVLAFKKTVTANSFINALGVVISTAMAAVGGAFVADRLFGRSIREESGQLARDSRHVYENELAVYMENTERKRNAAAAGQPIPEKTPEAVLNPAASAPGAKLRAQPRKALFAAHEEANRNVPATEGLQR